MFPYNGDPLKHAETQGRGTSLRQGKKATGGGEVCLPMKEMGAGIGKALG